MRIHRLWVYLKKSLCICSVMLTLASCTYDYFEDETNFWLYIPQIQENEIKNFYVAFHDASGGHVRTRLIEAPFDKDIFMKQGILRFKLPPGPYSITCFADYARGSITEGMPLAESYKAKEQNQAEPNLYTSRTGENTTDPRMLFFNGTAYPAGHPASKDTVEASLSDARRYKAEVITKFIDLPALVSRIDLLYSGLATKVNFDGTFSTFTPQDRIIASINTAQEGSTPNKEITFTDKINPSAGINFNEYLMSRSAPRGESLGLEVRFYDRQGQHIGTTMFTEDDLSALAPDRRPVDKQGNPVTHLILEPRQGITFTFKGFTLFQIELSGWGNITDGEITPM